MLLFRLLTVLLFALASPAQNPSTSTTASPNPSTSTSTAPANAPALRPQFFAGAITAITDDQITVSRTIVGHPTDTRTFQLTPKTKLNRSYCKPDAKVTVRYQRLPEGNVALQVLVHSGIKSTPAQKHS